MISIIIPTLNEEKALPATLASIDAQSFTGDYEIIIVDGGSTDQTRQVAQQHPHAHFISTTPGRATQMNAGANIAIGAWLLFLHADTLLPSLALTKIQNLSPLYHIKSGCFQQQFSGNHRLLKWISTLHNWRCRRTHIMYGDQAMFIRRASFHDIGGFPETSILEDVLFSEKLLKLGQPILLPEKVVTDSRKFVQRGIVRSFFEVALILTCYELRLPIIGRSFFSPIR